MTLAVAVVAVIAGLTWWFLRPTAEVIFPGGNDFGISLASTVGNRPYSIGAVVLCVSGVDSAVVDSVRPEHGRSLTVTDFALHPYLGTFGAEQVSLHEAGFGRRRVVTGQCATGGFSEIGLEFTKPTNATARVDGLIVSWHAGGQRGTARIPIHLVLCGGRDATVRSCQAIS